MTRIAKVYVLEMIDHWYSAVFSGVIVHLYGQGLVPCGKLVYSRPLLTYSAINLHWAHFARMGNCSLATPNSSPSITLAAFFSHYYGHIKKRHFILSIVLRTAYIFNIHPYTYIPGIFFCGLPIPKWKMFEQKRNRAFAAVSSMIIRAIHKPHTACSSLVQITLFPLLGRLIFMHYFSWHIAVGTVFSAFIGSYVCRQFYYVVDTILRLLYQIAAALSINLGWWLNWSENIFVIYVCIDVR